MRALFTPLSIRGIELRNRLWVSPMCQYSAIDGMPNDWHHVHLAQFAAGGAGLVIAEASAVSPEGRISPDDAGLWNEAQAEAWTPIVAAIRSRGAAAGVQLSHAGRKASTTSPLTGGRGTVPRDAGGWTTVAPSALAYDAFAEPIALDERGIEKVVSDFADAARRAVSAGFEVIEVHAAHGYLLHQFLSPLTNHRDDEYGGSFENRVRLLVRVTEAVREAVGDGAVFVRFSATDAAEGGWDVADTAAAARLVAAAGADLIDVSSGGLVPEQRIVPGPGYQVDHAATVRRETGLLVSAVGMIDDPTRSCRAANGCATRTTLSAPPRPSGRTIPLPRSTSARTDRRAGPRREHLRFPRPPAFHAHPVFGRWNSVMSSPAAGTKTPDATRPRPRGIRCSAVRRSGGARWRPAPRRPVLR